MAFNQDTSLPPNLNPRRGLTTILFGGMLKGLQEFQTVVHGNGSAISIINPRRALAQE
jgi:hypothetical protein